MAKIRILLLSLVIVLAHYGVSQAQRYIPDPDVYGKIRGAYQPVTLVARIGYNRDLGGYFVRNNPSYGFGNKVILNQNYEVLGKIARRGRYVTIFGRVSPLEFRAGHIYLETIDGRAYHGRRAPLVQVY